VFEYLNIHVEQRDSPCDSRIITHPIFVEHHRISQPFPKKNIVKYRQT